MIHKIRKYDNKWTNSPTSAVLKVGDDAYYRIHACFYDENGNVVFWGESSPHGESADALIADLEQMLADAKRSRDDIFDVPPERQ